MRSLAFISARTMLGTSAGRYSHGPSTSLSQGESPIAKTYIRSDWRLQASSLISMAAWSGFERLREGNAYLLRELVFKSGRGSGRYHRTLAMMRVSSVADKTNLS